MTRETAESSTAVAGAESEPPSWLRLTAFVPASAVLTLGSAGLLLAVNGVYRTWLAFAIGGGAWIALLVLARPAFAPSPHPPLGTRQSGSREANVIAAIGVVAIVAITAWNMANASEHMLIDRDGGSYTNTARWIARDGSLSVKARVGPFANEPTVGFDSLAVYEVPGGLMQFQFAHLLPVVLAEAYSVAGDTGMFRTPELLGGFALLAFFVLAWRLLRRPLFALSAMLALAFIIPQVSFARDSYSEIASQILLFTALWLLVTPRVWPQWRIALVAGLFLGALEATRIDGLIFLIGVPVVCAVAWLRRDEADRRPTLIAIVAFVLGLVPGLALGLVDLMRHSGAYYTDLRGSVRQLSLAIALSVAACAITVAIWRFVYPLLRRAPWNALSAGAAACVALLGFGVWALRPRLLVMHGNGRATVGLQIAEHLTADASRVYYERSLTWMSWYLGPLTLAAAIIGAALLVRVLLLGGMSRTLGTVAVLVPGCVLYLYRAHAVSDHVWVTRRFLLNAFPAIVLLAVGVAASAAAMQRPTRGVRALHIGAAVVAIVAVAYPLHTVLPVRSMAEETSYLARVKEVCVDVGPRAAIVVVEDSGTDLIDDWFPQTLRSWCGADVGVTRGPARATALHRLAREWEAEGRQLFVVSSSPGYVAKLLPDAPVKSIRRAVDAKFLAPTLTHRPDRYLTQEFQVVVARVPVR